MRPTVPNVLHLQKSNLVHPNPLYSPRQHNNPQPETLPSEESLALASACLAGNENALRELDTLLHGAPLAALRRLHLDDAMIDEVLQRLRERLLISQNGPPRLARYSGRGSLEGWLRICAVRLASDLKSERRLESNDSEEHLFAIAGNPSPELMVMRADMRAHAKTAFHRALCKLTSRQRSLLRLSFVEGLGIDRIAPIYGISRATIARWLAAAKREVVAGTRRELCCCLHLPENEIESLMASIKSHIDLSLSRALAEDKPE